MIQQQQSSHTRFALCWQDWWVRGLCPDTWVMEVQMYSDIRIYLSELLISFPTHRQLWGWRRWTVEDVWWPDTRTAPRPPAGHFWSSSSSSIQRMSANISLFPPCSLLLPAPVGPGCSPNNLRLIIRINKSRYSD